MPDHHHPHHPRVGWNGAWQPDPPSQDAFATIAPGTTLQVMKRAPDGSAATRYPATGVATAAPAPWIEVVATWVVPNVVVAGLKFVPGDTIREYFSPVHPFNAFAVITPDGMLRGWYGNVTYPSTIERVDGVPTLVWHDLYLDVVILPGDAPIRLDDDELAESGIPETDSEFATAIEMAREDLIATIPSLAPDLVT